MWEASLGIIAILGVMVSIGIIFSVSGAKPRSASRREIARASAATGATGATILNTEPDSKRDAAYQQASKGVSLDRPPAEVAAGGK